MNTPFHVVFARALVAVLCLQLAVPQAPVRTYAAEPTGTVLPDDVPPLTVTQQQQQSQSSADPNAEPANPAKQSAQDQVKIAELTKKTEEFEKKRKEEEKKRKMWTYIAAGGLGLAAVLLIKGLMDRQKAAAAARDKNKNAQGSKPGGGQGGSPSRVAGASNPRANDSRFNERQWPPTRGQETTEELVKKKLNTSWLTMPAKGPDEAEGAPKGEVGLTCKVESGAADSGLQDLKGIDSTNSQSIRSHLTTEIPKMALEEHRSLMNNGLTALDTVLRQHQADMGQDSSAIENQAKGLVESLKVSDGKGLVGGGTAADLEKASADVGSSIESEKARAEKRGQAGDEIAKAMDAGPVKVYGEARSAGTTQKLYGKEDGSNSDPTADSSQWAAWANSNDFKVEFKSDTLTFKFESYGTKGLESRDKFGQALKEKMSCTVAEQKFDKEKIKYESGKFSATNPKNPDDIMMAKNLNEQILPAAKKYFANRMARAIQHTYQAAAIENAYMAGHAVGFYELQNQSLETIQKLDADRIRITESQQSLRAPAGAPVPEDLP